MECSFGESVESESGSESKSIFLQVDLASFGKFSPWELQGFRAIRDRKRSRKGVGRGVEYGTYQLALTKSAPGLPCSVEK